MGPPAHEPAAEVLPTVRLHTAVSVQMVDPWPPMAELVLLLCRRGSATAAAAAAAAAAASAAAAAAAPAAAAAADHGFWRV